ncbi:MAG: polymer-forming cytoskeletal protein [Acidimicrobiia bacterium]|nr:polymer-forming cytoskeletal protein [Acidimicrobiia bacterium]
MTAMPAGYRYTGGRLRWVWMTGLVVLVVIGAAPPAAASVAESDLVWIVEDEVVSEDLYAVGNEVRISGRVEGDLVAVATDRLLVEGVVTGSVTALASRLVIEGEVGGSVVGAAADVTVTGQVGGDVVVGTLDLRVDGAVGRDILGAAWSGSAGGTVGRDLRGLFRSLDLGGEIGGDVEIRANRLHAEQRLSVLGDMDYQAAHLWGQEYLEGNVKGSSVNRRALPPNIRIRGFRLMAVLFMSLLVLVAGLVVVRLASSLVEAAADRAVRTPWRSLGKGLILAVSPLVGLAAMLMVVVWLPLYIWGPLLIGGVPFLTIAAGAWLLALLVSHIPVAVATGRAIGTVLGRRWDTAVAYLVGAVVYLLVLQIPVLGLPLAATAMVLGVGGWLGRRSGSPAIDARLPTGP